MKILFEKYPLLDFQTRKDSLSSEFFRMTLYQKMAASDYAHDKKYFTQYRKFMDYISSHKDIRTYLIAEKIAWYLFDNSEKLMTKMWPFLNNLTDSTGVIIWRDFTFFYNKFNDGDTAIILYFISKKDTWEYGLFTKEKTEEGVRGNSQKSVLSNMAFVFGTLILPFLEFAECETKVVNSTGNKKAVVNYEKYISNIPSNIEIVDSNWFTTLIRSDAFKVSGHFRLQPVGPGRTGRKMTWIKDFEKHGYTRRSKLEIRKEEG